MHFVLLEDSIHPIVTEYLTLVFWILQVMGFNVDPNFLDNLRTRKLDSLV